MIKGIIMTAVIALAMVFPAKHALHMFQQNRYELGRLNKWVKASWRTNAEGAVVPLALTVIGLLAGLLFKGLLQTLIEIAILIFMALYLYADEKKKNYIKPLVYTARVKRQIAVLAVLALILIILVMKLPPLYAAAAYLGPWLLIWPMALITSPMEAAIRQKYLNEAKAILKDHKDLIKIGITGSFGKTTTKNIMQAMLSEQYNSLMTPASYNTPMGITRTIREMLKPIHKVFVCEMGADHVGDITELMEFVKPQIGVVTSVGPQHLNTFGSQENITKEKMQVIEMLPADGFGIMNYDNDFIRNYPVKNTVEKVTYGVHSRDTDYYADEITYTSSGSVFTVVHGEERVQLETKLLGELNILNILSAVACARYLGVEWNVIARAVKTMKQVEHRLELKVINGHRFIDDAFNANPTGSAMALDVLGMMPGTRWIVTPGMIDLGARQEEINKEFGRNMKGKADEVILVGRNQTKPIYAGLQEAGFDMDHVYVVDTVKEAFAIVYSQADADDTILLENDLPDAFNH